MRLYYGHISRGKSAVGHYLIVIIEKSNVEIIPRRGPGLLKVDSLSNLPDIVLRALYTLTLVILLSFQIECRIRRLKKKQRTTWTTYFVVSSFLRII
jgi:hypothetical protein